MRILFDHGTPAPLMRFLVGHEVTEQAGFEPLDTTDENMALQQKLRDRTIAIVVQRNAHKVAETVNAATPGSYTEVEIPFS